MKYLVALSLFVVALACTPPPTLPPAAMPLFTADQAALRLGELGDAAIALNQSGVLADVPAVRIAKFVQVGVDACSASPDGWAAAVKVLWTALKQDLGPTIAAQLGKAWTTLDQYLGGVTP
jgi:hypothetical protein